MIGPVRVLLCRVGCAPVVTTIAPDAQGSHLAAMQALVGGSVELLQLDGEVDLWCNEDASGLPLNCVIPARAPAVPDGWDVIEVGDDLARPGEMGEWRIRGDFFLARSHDGDPADLTDTDIASWTELWRSSALAVRRGAA